MLPRSAEKVKPKQLVALIGPTASGKSALAVAIAGRFGGEVVSADSRQVYRGLDIGSGKITRREMCGVPHHLLDVANPRVTFTVAQYQRLARRAINDIWRRGRLPILCGGTGFYIDAVLNGTSFPAVRPNASLRQRLEQRTARELFGLLHTKDQARARTIDRHNKRRLIRALEIATALGRVPPPTTGELPDVLIIGLRQSKHKLQRLIKTRLAKRLRQGLVGEVRRLHRLGLSWSRLESFGLEYRAVARHLQGKLSKAELEQTILRESWQYARRQMTWFKKTNNIHWVNSAVPASRIVSKYLQHKKIPASS